MAIALAREMTPVGSTGIAGLSKELRLVMAEAVEGKTSGLAESPVEDEVEKARRARDEKARQAVPGDS